jgi:hypothetical protein
MKLFLSILCAVLFLGCKKNTTEKDFYRSVTMDIKSYDLGFRIKKVHNLTDSIYFEFTTKNLYDCDQYVINMAVNASGKNIEITLGNVYKIIGFCTYGSFPAIGQYKSPALPTGEYGLFVKKDNVRFDGKVTVTNAAYTISWEHDLHCMEINPKVLNK